ncbi:MAG: DUF2520 domain-containing protein [Bacteroidetes bacterium]|nr:MAG: DUF2520 domain-containing protein [Bacteroidota bacterium]
MKRIVIIGAGNVGYHLATGLCNDIAHYPWEILIINRQANAVTEKLEKKNIPVKIGLNCIPNIADVYVICTKDDSIEEVAQKLTGKVSEHSVVLHTSGAVESTVLKEFKNYGVLYPLYSFLHTENIDWSKIPLFIVGNNTYAGNNIQELAKNLHPKGYYIIDDNLKLHIHLLAVMSNNFINALMHAVYRLSNELPDELNIYEIMKKFSVQTIERIKHYNPADYQTGPAIRFDYNTIQKHLQYLNQYPEIKQLYLCFNQYIQTAIADAGSK